MGRELLYITNSLRDRDFPSSSGPWYSNSVTWNREITMRNNVYWNVEQKRIVYEQVVVPPGHFLSVRKVEGVWTCALTNNSTYPVLFDMGEYVEHIVERIAAGKEEEEEEEEEYEAYIRRTEEEAEREWLEEKVEKHRPHPLYPDERHPGDGDVWRKYSDE